MKEVTKEQLEDLYIKQNLSLKQVKNIIGINIHALQALVEQYGLVKSRELIREQRRKTNLEKYGVDHPSKTKEVQERTKQTNRELYGCDHHILSDKVKEKIKKTNLEKYGKENFLQSDIGREVVQKACLEKYGSISPMGNKKIREKVNETLNKRETKIKRINTQKANGHYNTSQPEEQAYKLLVEKFGIEDVVRQYSSKLYPWQCDFYIKSIDTYIEYQGSWTHGRQPYNPLNPIHNKLVRHWQDKNTDYFSYAVKIWTQRDPEKRRVARSNKLNWLEFFSLDELENWL